MRNPVLAVIAIVLLAQAAMPAHAQKVYSWKDKAGTMHYSDIPPPKEPAREMTLDESAAQPAALPAQAASTSSPKLKAAEADYRSRACTAAHNDLDLVNKGGLVINGNDVTRAKKLNAADMVAAKASANKRIVQFCVSKK